MFQDAINNSVPANNVIPIQFGLEAVSLDPMIATKLGASGANGVLVNRVIDNSPASFAFIQRGDIITAIAGVPIEAIGDIPQIASHLKPGNNVHVRFIRNGRTSEVIVKIR